MRVRFRTARSPGRRGRPSSRGTDRVSPPLRTLRAGPSPYRRVGLLRLQSRRPTEEISVASGISNTSKDQQPNRAYHGTQPLLFPLDESRWRLHPKWSPKSPPRQGGSMIDDILEREIAESDALDSVQ